MSQENQEQPLFEVDNEKLMSHDLTEEDQEKSFFCDTNGENYYLFGFCIGKVVTYWIGGVIAALGGLGTIASQLFG